MPNQWPKLPKFNPKADLPYLAALAQTAQYALAGYVLLGDSGWFFGGIMGLLVSFTMAYAASQYTEVAAARRPFVFWGMLLIGALSPIIIGTSMFMDLPVSIIPIWRGIVGAVWGILPDASVALTGFVAGKGLVAQDKPASGEQAVAQEAKPTKKAAKEAAQVAQADSNQPEPVAQAAPVVAQVVAPVAQVAQDAPPAFTDDNMIAQYLLNPLATNAALAKVFGVSPQAVSSRRLALEQQARIRKDGKAVKVLPVMVEVGA